MYGDCTTTCHSSCMCATGLDFSSQSPQPQNIIHSGKSVIISLKSVGNDKNDPFPEFVGTMYTLLPVPLSLNGLYLHSTNKLVKGSILALSGILSCVGIVP